MLLYLHFKRGSMHCSFIMFTFTMFTCNLYIKQCNRKPLTDGNSVTVLAVKMCNSIMQKKKLIEQ